MSDSPHLTILLTLKDRAPFTERWLRYAASVRLPFRILVADGSQGNEAEPLVAAARAAGLDIEYVRHPVDRSYAIITMPSSPMRCRASRRPSCCSRTTTISSSLPAWPAPYSF